MTWPHSSLFSTFNFSLPLVASGNGLAFVRIWLRAGRFSDCPQMFCRCHMPSNVRQPTICDGKFGWAYFTKHITISFILLFSNEWILFLKWFVEIARSSLHFGHFESVIRWIYPINSCDLLFRWKKSINNNTVCNGIVNSWKRNDRLQIVCYLRSVRHQEWVRSILIVLKAAEN